LVVGCMVCWSDGNPGRHCPPGLARVPDDGQHTSW
jgi:hypothetical protein